MSSPRNQSQLSLSMSLCREADTPLAGSHQNLMIASARVDVCAGGHGLIVMKKASHQFAAGSFAGPRLEKRETWGRPPTCRKVSTRIQLRNLNTFLRSSDFDAWLSHLADQKAKARILARLASATFGNFGDCEPVGEGVSEMRVHVGAGYRVYYTRTGSTVLVLPTMFCWLAV